MRYLVYTGYHVASDIELGLCSCTVDNPLAKARGLSLYSGAQTILLLSLVYIFRQFILNKWQCGLLAVIYRHKMKFLA